MQSTGINIDQAFEKIFKQYFNPLVYFINSYINNKEDSKEIVQNTFVKLWANRDQLVIQNSIKGYLFQASKNMMVDFIRANKKHSKNEEFDLSKLENVNFDIQKDLDPQLIKQAIFSASKNLDSKTQTIFNLWSLEGLTYEEIAAHLNVSKRTVDYNISKAFDYLKDELKNSEIIFEQ